MDASRLAPDVAPRRAYRSTDDRWLGGVASGLAEHLGLPVLWVRMGLLALVAFGGFGAVLYAGLWLFLPARRHTDPLSPGLDAATRQGKRGGRRERRLTDYGPLVAVGAIAIGVLLLGHAGHRPDAGLGPLLLAGAGVAVLWWQADEAQRQRWHRPVASGWARSGPSSAAGAGAPTCASVPACCCSIAAITLFSLRSGSLTVALNVGLAAAFGIVGLGLHGRSLAAPALLRPQRGARGAGAVGGTRRRRCPPARLRAPDPCADPALGRRPADGLPAGPRPGARPALVAVRRPRARARPRWQPHCARWLPRWRTPTASRSRWSAWVTRRSPTRTVRWCSATREAITNAAKHSGASTVDVYAEATASGVEVFVRDRGAGFDPDRVAEDRQGVRSSIIGRMERHGGSASVRSMPGEGTEVRLSLPTDRRAPDRPRSPHESTHRRHRRRPRHVPHRGAGRARQLGRRRRRGGRRRPGRAPPYIEHRPEVVLLDVHLPGGGGAEVMRRVAHGQKQEMSTRFLALSRLGRGRGRDRHDPGGGTGLRHQDDHRSGAGGRDRAGGLGGRGVLAAAGGVRAGRVRGDHRGRGRRRGPRPAHRARARGDAADRARLLLQGGGLRRCSSRSRPSRPTCPRCCASCSCPRATSSPGGRRTDGCSEAYRRSGRAGAGWPRPAATAARAAASPRPGRPARVPGSRGGPGTTPASCRRPGRT